MKKNLLAIGFLALALPAAAQNVVMHVDNTAKVYVGKNALVFNGGGLQTKGDGQIDNHGNVMIDGTGTTGSVYRNLNAAGAVINDGPGGQFINRLNEPANFALVNPAGNLIDPLDPPAAPVYTYGQLYVQGLAQTDITGVVNQEYRAVSDGAYQQMAFPFYDKPVSSLSTELGSNFNTSRYSGKEVLYWSNPNVVSKNLPATGLATRMGVGALSPATYYIVGGTDLNLASTKTLVGRPVATMPVEILNSVLAGGVSAVGSSASFGLNGNNKNEYNEKYNSYLQDNFSTPGGLGAWVGNFGKNIFQYGNPYMTNLDLSKIAFEDNVGIGDGNSLENIYGVRLDARGVVYNGGAGGGSSTYKYITFDTNGTLTGDVDYTMIRPMGTFVIKLKSNTGQTLNMATLRRFKYSPRYTATDYNVAAAKSSSTAGTVKQLGVIGLDVNGNEVARTYYVLSPNTISGHTQNPTVQVANGSGISFGTYEEDALNGGYDNNNVSYWLYINEANENNFLGKNLKLVNYNPDIVSFKFEVRENAGKIPEGQHLLSSGKGFYYKKSGSGTVNSAVQGAIVTAQAGTNAGVEYDLYYGEPNQSVLAASETVKKSRTLVVYSGDDNGYFVRFDPSWKNADIQVYDMSGKVVLSKKGVDASRDFKLELADDVKVTYVVSIVSDKGEKVNTKIIK